MLLREGLGCEFVAFSCVYIAARGEFRGTLIFGDPTYLEGPV